MSAMNALFAAAWVGDAAAQDALTDWILENVFAGNTPDATYTPGGNSRWVGADYHYAPGGVGELMVYIPTGLPDKLAVAFTEPALGLQECKHFDRERFAVEFPAWLGEQIEFLYYVSGK